MPWLFIGLPVRLSMLNWTDPVETVFDELVVGKGSALTALS